MDHIDLGTVVAPGDSGLVVLADHPITGVELVSAFECHTRKLIEVEVTGCNVSHTDRGNQKTIGCCNTADPPETIRTQHLGRTPWTEALG